MNVIIFCNAGIKDYGFVRGLISQDDYIICCDGGLRHADELDISPDIIVGDFDSAPPPLIEKYKRMGVPLVKYPVKKDYTDLETCIQLASGQHPDELLIFGAIGGRLDHTLTNVHVLRQALSQNMQARVIDETHSVALTDSEFTVTGNVGDIVSLIPLTTEVTGVVTDGLEFPLVDETLHAGYGRGLSNRLTKNNAVVKITGGLLFVITARE